MTARLAFLAPIAALALLAGCGERPRPVPTLVPIATVCVTGDLPDEPPMVQSELTGDSGRDIGIIAGSAIQLRAYGRALLGLLNACRTAPPPAQGPTP